MNECCTHRDKCHIWVHLIALLFALAVDGKQEVAKEASDRTDSDQTADGLGPEASRRAVVKQLEEVTDCSHEGKDEAEEHAERGGKVNHGTTDRTRKALDDSLFKV